MPRKSKPLETRPQLTELARTGPSPASLAKTIRDWVNQAEPPARGERVGRERLARLMRQDGRRGVTRRRFTVTTRRGKGRPAPDRVERRFGAEAPHLLWVATRCGAHHRFPDHCGVLVPGRRGRPVEPQGRRMGHGDAPAHRCTDNALAERFFATLECELLQRHALAPPRETRARVFNFIEGFYNTRRRHSALGTLSPVDFEREAGREVAAAKVPIAYPHLQPTFPQPMRLPQTPLGIRPAKLEIREVSSCPLRLRKKQVATETGQPHISPTRGSR